MLHNFIGRTVEAAKDPLLVNVQNTANEKVHMDVKCTIYFLCNPKDNQDRTDRIIYTRVSHLPQNASTGLVPLNSDLPMSLATVWRMASLEPE